LSFHVDDPEKPVLCQDERRKFVFVPLGPESRIPATSDALRMFSTQTSFPPQPRRNTMHQTPVPVAQEDAAPKTPANDSLVEQLNALRAVLRHAYSQAGQLLSAIKKHDKRTRHLQTALASLRQLQQVA